MLNFEYGDRIGLFTVFVDRMMGHRCVGVVDDFGSIVCVM
jgi:hypothetical protein